MALETNPVLSLQSLNPSGKGSRQKALKRSSRKLLAGGLLVRIAIVVPSSPVPLIYDLVAKAGAYILGMPSVSQTEAEPHCTTKPEPVPEPAISEGKEPMTLDERINSLQERINS